jgi:hypothetical protein
MNEVPTDSTDTDRYGRALLRLQRLLMDSGLLEDQP